MPGSHAHKVTPSPSKTSALSGDRMPWSESTDDVCASLYVNPRIGLPEQEVAKRLETYGLNKLQKKKARSKWTILLAQLRSVVVLLLAVGGAVSFAFGHLQEGLAIVGVIVLNTIIGFIAELRAVRSMEALARLGSPLVAVRRDGEVKTASAQELVPGDILIVEAGDSIAADARLIESSKVQADESVLTGESLPVSKSTQTLPKATDLGDRKNMLFKGTFLSRGHGEAIVTATSMSTVLGTISSLVSDVEPGDSPLAERLEQLGRALAWATLVCVAIVGVSGIISGKAYLQVIEMAIALAVATVPEGLPVVATLVLAKGMWRMARSRALVRDLSAVETLGSTSIVLTDKTGTLTENQLTLSALGLPQCDVVLDTDEGGRLQIKWPAETDPHDDLIETMLRGGALCTDATYNSEDDQGIGDPLEVALLIAAHRFGLPIDSLEKEYPKVDEVAFDPDTRMMATIHEHNGSLLVSVKGAVDALIERSEATVQSDGQTTPLDEEQKQAWLKRADNLAERGYRVLGLARREDFRKGQDPQSNLTFLGLLGFVDPPRRDVIPAIEACKGAGMKVVMVTGDHAATAANIGRQVGIYADATPPLNGSQLHDASDQELQDMRIAARMTPVQKLQLLKAYQRQGEIVAMLGDGVNDAPTLRRADIGIAMGKRGTQVAQDASDIVLLDDDFATIPAAIEQGRAIFDNIRKFVVYLVSCNLSEILTIGIAAAINTPLPITALQILFLNLITDVFPAFALGACPAHDEIMTQPPRPKQEAFVTAHHWRIIVLYGALLSSCVLGGFLITQEVLDGSYAECVTVSFLILALGQLFHTFNMASAESPVFSNEVTKNKWVWAAIVLCLILIAAGVYIEPLADLLTLTPPSVDQWLVAASMSLVPLAIGRLFHLGKRLKTKP